MSEKLLQSVAHHLFEGWRVRRGRVTIRFNPLRFYVGVGLTFGYFALNLGPVQVFFDWADWIGRLLRIRGNGETDLT